MIFFACEMMGVGGNKMNISLLYEPNKGIFYDGRFIPWGMKRKTVREVFQSDYEILDREFEGTVSYRDIYNRLLNQPVLLCLNYDVNNLFSELEVHNGIELKVFGKILNFEMGFWDAVKALNEVSEAENIIDEGVVLFSDLNLSICSGASMGGEQDDNRLSYIYCGEYIKHLLE